jgi:hypothetical protein
MLNSRVYPEIFNECINVWFKKWRDAPPQSDIDWDRCHKEAEAIYRKYPYQITADLCADLYAELSRRSDELKKEQNGNGK